MYLSAAEDMIERIKRIYGNQVKRFEIRREDLIKVADDKNESNAWLNRVGWAQHLEKLDPATLRRTRDQIQEDEIVL